MKDDPSLDIIGIDLAVGTLITSTRKRFNPDVVKARFDFVGGDTEQPPLAENAIDVGIAVNAAIYKPEFLLSTLYHALKPEAKCVVNFRVYGDPDNAPFFDTQVRRGATIRDATPEDRKQLSLPPDETISLKIVDYSTHEDGQLRSLGYQAYFTSRSDIERLFTKIGFKLSNHAQFRYRSPDNENPGNRIEVYTLEKPKLEPKN